MVVLLSMLRVVACIYRYSCSCLESRRSSESAVMVAAKQEQTRSKERDHRAKSFSRARAHFNGANFE
jgi:hypothetical protein